MYGLEDEDPVVRFYDETLAISGESELNWYLEEVRTFGGPVLDLACGTGRISLLIAREGYNVVCIDKSGGMLTVFKRKLEKESLKVQKKISIIQSSMSAFCLGHKFSTIICCDAFFHNITVQEEIACLQRVVEHLKKDGRFVFNIPYPTCEFLLKCADPESSKFSERKSYVLANNDTVRIEEAQAIDFLTQTITTTLRYTLLNPEGEEIEVSGSAWKTRYMFQFEAVHLLQRCGLKVESVVGDYNNGPVTTTGQLIFQAKHAE